MWMKGEGFNNLCQDYRHRLSQTNWDMWEPTLTGNSWASMFSMRNTWTPGKKDLKREYGTHGRVLLTTLLTQACPA